MNHYQKPAIDIVTMETATIMAFSEVTTIDGNTGITNGGGGDGTAEHGGKPRSRGFSGLWDEIDE